MSEFLTKIEEYKRFVDEIQSEFSKNRKQYQSAIAQRVAELMNAAGYKRVLVCGYTPYFNDGEPCRYSVSYMIGTIDTDSDFEDLRDAAWEYEPLSEEVQSHDLDYMRGVLPQEITDLSNFLKELGDKAFEEFFEEGVIEFRSDGTWNVSWYEHD